MKAILLLAVIFGAVTFANAQTLQDDKTGEKQEISTVVQTTDEWKDVKTEDLSEKVQAAVKTYEENFTVKAMAYNATSKQTKLTLENKTDNSETKVILNEEGEEVKE